MRIIAGSRRSRLLLTLPGLSTRPTLDKVKEALFSRLDPWIVDKRVLDLFAGSGNIGLEALSRGAKQSTFVDGAQDAIRIIQQNIDQLDFKAQADVYKMDAFQACRYFKNKAYTYDLIYCDPPFGKINLEKLFKALLPISHEETIVVLEHPKIEDFSFSSDFILEKSLSYGTITLHYLRRHR